MAHATAGPSSRATAERLVCWFGCGEGVHLQNIGNRRSARYVCGPCLGAKRAIEGQARRDPALRQALQELKTENLSLFKAKVVAARVTPDTARPGESGLGNRSQRREAVAEFLGSIEVAARVEEEEAVIWPDEPEYIAHMKNVRNMAAEQAADAWRRDAADPDVKKRGSGSSLRVAVGLPPVTHARHTKSLKRTVQASAGISTQQQMDLAARRCRLDIRSSDRELSGLAGGVFKAGAASVGGAASAVSASVELHTLPGVDIELTDLQATTNLTMEEEDEPATTHATAARAPVPEGRGRTTVPPPVV